MKKNIVVISGGPGFGKTALIQKLEKSGFRVGHELARELMEEQVRSGGDLLPWRNGPAFRNAILKARIEFYRSVGVGELAFSDRAIPDQLAFSRYRGFKDPEILLKKVKEFPYFPLVFITSPWQSIFKQDSVRKETFEEASQLHEVICRTYAMLGYQLVELPQVSVEERIQFILNHITS